MREEEIQQRLRMFLMDMAISLKPLQRIEDKIQFTKALIELQMKIYKNDDENFNEDDFIDEHLLAKFRNKMTAFVESNLHHYFSPEELYQESIYDRLKISPVVILDNSEFYEFTIRLNNILFNYKTKLYLLEPNKPEAVNETDSLEGLMQPNTKNNLAGNLKLQNDEFSRTRQVIAMFYLFKSFGFSRNQIPLTAMAKLAHVLSAMPYDNTDNSPIYGAMKKFSKKKDFYLLEDFKFVRKHFVLVELTDAIALVDKEISQLEAKLKEKD